MTPNELVLTFGGLHLCVKFDENRQRNATVRVMTHGQTHRQTDRQTQTDFITCPIAICYSNGTDDNNNNNNHGALERKDSRQVDLFRDMLYIYFCLYCYLWCLETEGRGRRSMIEVRLSPYVYCAVAYLQGSHISWKVLEFLLENFLESPGICQQ